MGSLISGFYLSVKADTIVLEDGPCTLLLSRSESRYRAWNSSWKWGFLQKWTSKIGVGGGGGIFSVGEKSASILFSYEIKMMDLGMQIEDTKLTFIMHFSVLDYSNLPPECQKLHRFQSWLSTFFKGHRIVIENGPFYTVSCWDDEQARNRAHGCASFSAGRPPRWPSG